MLLLGLLTPWNFRHCVSGGILVHKLKFRIDRHDRVNKTAVNLSSLIPLELAEGQLGLIFIILCSLSTMLVANLALIVGLYIYILIHAFIFDSLELVDAAFRLRPLQHDNIVHALFVPLGLLLLDVVFHIRGELI